MNTSSAIRLITLAAIWGGSFLFMRISAPVMGSVALIEARVGLAALFLLLVGLYLRKGFGLIKHWRYLLLVGFFNSALPFFMFAFAAQTITASLLSILNASTPLWGAVIGAIWHRTKLPLKVVCGLAMGVFGVTILVGYDSIILEEGATIAIAAALLASLSYAIAGTIAESAPKMSSFDNAHGSMWAAAIIILPFLPFFPVRSTPSLDVMLVILMLGVVCTGLAYVLYFRLIADVGASSAMSVTFIVPVFGIIWGSLFLDEIIGWHTLLGAFFVIGGTALVTGFSPGKLWFKRNKHA